MGSNVTRAVAVIAKAKRACGWTIFPDMAIVVTVFTKRGHVFPGCKEAVCETRPGESMGQRKERLGWVLWRGFDDCITRAEEHFGDRVGDDPNVMYMAVS